MYPAAASGPVVYTIRLRRALIATWRALLAYAVAVILASTLGSDVLHWQVLAATATVVVPLVSVLAWQWDTTTGRETAERDAQVRVWRAVTGRRPGIAGAAEHATRALEQWLASEWAGLRVAGGAW